MVVTIIWLIKSSTGGVYSPALAVLHRFDFQLLHLRLGLTPFCNMIEITLSRVFLLIQLINLYNFEKRILAEMASMGSLFTRQISKPLANGECVCVKIQPCCLRLPDQLKFKLSSLQFWGVFKKIIIRFALDLFRFDHR